MVRLEEGIWSLAVEREHGPAAFTPVGTLHDVETAVASLEASQGHPLRAVVEVAALTGGVRPRGLIGGSFTPAATDQLALHVHHTGALGFGVPPDCPSLLSGRPLVVGLPAQFAEAAIDGLVRVTCRTSLPSGTLTVDRAGHDEVESSQVVFEKAAGILRCVLAAAHLGSLPDGDELRALLR